MTDLLPETDATLSLFFQRVHECRDKRSLSHSLHPYPAKFIPEIPRRLIESLSQPGDTVLDPMCGSGTTVVEATALGRRGIGIDLNPVAVLAATAKTLRLSNAQVGQLTEFALRLREDASTVDLAGCSRDLAGAATAPQFLNRDKWFEPHVVAELAHMRFLARSIQDPVVRCAALCAFSASIVEVSNQESETRWCAKPSGSLPGDALRVVARRLQAMTVHLTAYRDADPAAAMILRGLSQQLPLGDATCDLAVTSPPYANSHDYYLYNKLRLFWLGEDVRSVQRAEIGSRHRHSDKKESIDTYLSEMGDVLGDVARVLRPGGHFAVVVADAVIRGEFFTMGELYRSLGSDCGLIEAASYRFTHQHLNRLFQPSYGTAAAKQTHIVVFRKPGSPTISS